MRSQFWRRSPVLACVALGAATAVLSNAHAAPISWERTGPFQSCLEVRLQGWVKDKAELVVNESPAASDLDDLDVALWTVQALESCEAQVGRGDQSAEVRFGRHMARWREHIDEVAEDFRRRSRPD